MTVLSFFVFICFFLFISFVNLHFHGFFSLDLTVFLVSEFLLVLVLLSSLYTVGYARTNVIGSRISFVIASSRSSIH